MNYLKRLLALTLILLGTEQNNYGAKKPPKKQAKPILTSAYIKQNNQLLQNPFAHCTICNKSMARFWLNGGHKMTAGHKHRAAARYASKKYLSKFTMRH